MPPLAPSNIGRLLIAAVASIALFHGVPVAGHDESTSARSVSTGRSASAKFRDCPHCPEMIVVPPGGYTLEVPAGGELYGVNTDSPIRVTIGKAFAIGIYDVTRDEYAEFVRETGRPVEEGCETLDPTGRWITDPGKNWRNPGFRQTGRDPVVCVNWDDAHSYVRWLNEKVTGKSGERPYRLPSGEEWEYAARGGSGTLYSCGLQPNHNCANFGLDQCWPCGAEKQGNDRWYYTSPVGSFAPNPFGLYDAIGNVYQWTDDCYHETIRGAPGDGSVWTGGDCNLRILRGGAWNDTIIYGLGVPIAMIAAHNTYPVDARNYANGFRVMRTLN